MKSNKFILEDKGYTNLIPLVMVIVIIFALIFIGSYITGTIDTELTSAFATNTASGSVNDIYWHNATGNGSSTYRNTSLSCTAGELTGATTGINVYNNGSDALWFNLTTNTATTYNQSIANAAWVNTTLTSLIASGNVSNSHTYLNFSWLTNASHNRVRIRIIGTYYSQSDYRSSIENATVDRLKNQSENFDSTLDIVQVTIIITVLASAIGAIFLFTRMR